jgi:hypothetical protein
VYSVGINGVISKIAKKDICRLLVKQKEKIKNVQVHKVLQIKVTESGDKIAIETGENVKEDSNDESYVRDSKRLIGVSFM